MFILKMYALILFQLLGSLKTGGWPWADIFILFVFYCLFDIYTIQCTYSCYIPNNSWFGGISFFLLLFSNLQLLSVHVGEIRRYSLH